VRRNPVSGGGRSPSPVARSLEELGLIVKVLVVTQASAIRTALEGILRSRGDLCEVAGTGDDVAGSFDAVVIDPALGEEAVALCRRLRREMPAATVLIAGGADGDRLRALLEAGADDWLAAPLEPRDLDLRLRLAAERRGLGAAAAERLAAVEEELRRERAFFQQLFRNSPSGIVILDNDDRIVDANQPFCEMFQYPLEELVGYQLSDRIVPEELRAEAQELSELVFHQKSVARETVRKRKDGTALDVVILGYPIELADRRIGAYGIYTDVTERKRAERRLFHDAFHDPLTGLPNRSMLIDRLERALQRTRRGDFQFALLFIDLDGFKAINDGLGHAAGDELLTVLARRLEACLRPGDTTARFGGDEFMILLEGITRTSDATRIAERVLERLREPLEIAGQEVLTSGTIGIAFSATGYQDVDEMIRDADLAMYRAKAAGKARYEIFDTAMHQRVVERLRLEGELQQAIAEGGLMLDYQPIVSLRSGRLVGLEALVRWPHPERGRLEPRELIPVAEESGLIVPLGRWALEEACRQLVIWQERFPERDGLVVHVNVSPREIARSAFYGQACRVLEATGAPAAAVGLELSEQAIQESDAEMLWRLHNRGFRLQIDDFGIGISSLSALQRLPLDSIKIDRSFIRGLAPGNPNHEVVRAVAALADSLGLQVVAEGVETEEQLALLRKLEVHFAQGYLFSRPLAADAATALIARDPRW